jgi:hypothetical protein
VVVYAKTVLKFVRYCLALILPAVFLWISDYLAAFFNGYPSNRWGTFPRGSGYCFTQKVPQVRHYVNPLGNAKTNYLGTTPRVAKGKPEYLCVFVLLVVFVYAQSLLVK